MIPLVLEYCFMLYVPFTGIVADIRACPQKNCARVLENGNRRTLFLNVTFFPTFSLFASSNIASSQSRFCRPLPSGGVPPPMSLTGKEKVFGRPRLQAASFLD